MESAAKKRGYFEAMVTGARSFLEGLAVTFTYVFRKPVTVQYPDRIPTPIPDTLPERYRGFLEVDMDVCTACKACERDCPIDCIAIDLEKVDGQRAMTRFDIDLGKCMYCGLCVEACPTDARAPGDAETTKAIRFTREFEGVAPSFPELTFRFIRPGDYVVPFKPKKGETPETRRRGEIARASRRKAREYNALAARWALEHGGGPKQVREEQDRAAVDEATVAARAAQLLEALGPRLEEPAKLADLLYDEAFAQTDCGACGHPTCYAYADALLAGKEKDAARCEPAGAAGVRDAVLLVRLREGKSVAEATRLAIEAAAPTAKKDEG